MIKPTIGRVVLVYRAHPNGSDQYEPALITYVWDEETINVAGFTSTGAQFAISRITLRHDSVADEPSTLELGSEPFACWMPYQRHQAAEAGAKVSHQR